ncbi:S-layer homology domain-containing protein [Paenibacillus durus]|uniref:S-layer homology domain-containing protein n=1 Tax=Paenibacillus durus TaxID=44251 RepID=UPI0004716C8E|nr:S-layer homology domain-containing protein [Paenibacillus durus]
MKSKLISSFIALSLAAAPASVLADTINVNNGIINNGTMIVQFNDIKSDSWAYQAVTSMSERKVINGYEDGSFRPNNSISREEFAKMIAVTFSLDQPVTQAVYFSDVPATRWSFPYITAAKDYLTGYYPPKGKAFFDPSEPATREDVAAALVKIMELDTTNYSSRFTDENKISPQLKKYVNVAAEYNLITGYEDGTFKPLNSISRAEAAALLYRAIKSIGGSETPNEQSPNPSNQTIKTNPTGSSKTSNNGPNLWVDVVKEDTLPGGKPSILVKGETEPDATVTVNGEEVLVGFNGEFSTNIFVVEDGKYNIEVKSEYFGKTTAISKSIEFTILPPKLKLDKPDPQTTTYAEFVIWFEWVDQYDARPALYVNGEKRLYSLGGRRGNGEIYSGSVTVNLRNGENNYDLKLVDRYGKESATVTKVVYLK